MASQIIFIVLTFLLGSSILVNGDGVCTYFVHNVGYACSFYTTLTVATPESIELVITGTHMSGKTDADVKFIQQNNARMDFIPPSIFRKFANIVEADFVNVGLKMLTAETFKNALNLKKAWLRDNQVQVLPGNIFAKTKVDHIDLKNNRINDIKWNAFVDSPNVETLELHDNDIVWTFDARVFQNLANLKTLLISANSITEIPEDAFKNCQKLEYLSLGRNRLYNIKSAPFKPLTSLKKLHLYRNGAAYIEKSIFDSLQKLEEFEFNDNECANFVLYGIKNVNLQIVPRMEDCFSQRVNCHTTCNLI